VDDPRVSVRLSGVQETALWNLYYRASAARAGLLNDPRAVAVVDRLDYPFQRFDSPFRSITMKLHALRVRTFDEALRRLLDDAGDSTVVALGEGFETQFWRVDNGRLRWLSLDVPEVVAVREQAFPEDPRTRTLSGSATDPAWTDHVDRARPVIITAQGLLMYFDADEVHRLISAWARLLPGAWLVFDVVTPHLQAIRRRSPRPPAYDPPPWMWTFDEEQLRELRHLPGVVDVREIPQARGDRMLTTLRRLPGLKKQLPIVPVYQAHLGIT
jgi:O-methyltransferase involved in polyketide biosynthesis